MWLAVASAHVFVQNYVIARAFMMNLFRLIMPRECGHAQRALQPHKVGEHIQQLCRYCRQDANHWH